MNKDNKLESVYKFADKVIEWWLKLKVSVVNKVTVGFFTAGSALLLSPSIVGIINIFDTDLEFSLTGNDPEYGMILMTFSFILAVLVLVTDKIVPVLKERLDNEKHKIWQSLVVQDIKQFTEGVTSYYPYLNTYAQGIMNKGGRASEKDAERAEIDKKVYAALAELAIHVPRPFFDLLTTIRKVVSCSFHNEKTVNYTLQDIVKEDYIEDLRVSTVVEASLDIFDDYYKCLMELSRMLTEKKLSEEEVISVLAKYSIGSDFISTYKGVPYRLAYKYILFSEYPAEGKEAGTPFVLK